MKYDAKLHKNSGLVRYWELVICDVFLLLINDVPILTGQGCKKTRRRAIPYDGKALRG